MRKFKANLAAFTLIEMVVSISIITTITALFIANYRSANSRSDLTMNAQSLVADLHLAQNNSLGLAKYNNSLPGGGWGISFDVNQSFYTIFADLNDPGTFGYMVYNSGEGDITYGARVIDLPPNTEITSLAVGSPLVEYDQINVTFLPPDPQTNIYNGTATSTNLEITLKDNDTQATKTIRVNFLGLIEVVD